MVKVTLKKHRLCKNSVVFKVVDNADIEVFTSIYLMNSAYELLSKPELIEVTVKRGGKDEGSKDS